MRKGQMGLVMMLIVGSIGLLLVADVTLPFCNCIGDTNAITFNGTGVNVSGECEGTKCATDYYLVCNGTELRPATDYNIYTNCNLTMLNATYENSTCNFHYTYQGPNYDSGLLGLVVCYIPILFAVGLMILAVGVAGRG